MNPGGSGQFPPFFSVASRVSATTLVQHPADFRFLILLASCVFGALSPQPVIAMFFLQLYLTVRIGESRARFADPDAGPLEGSLAIDYAGLGLRKRGSASLGEAPVVLKFGRVESVGGGGGKGGLSRVQSSLARGAAIQRRVKIGSSPVRVTQPVGQIALTDLAPGSQLVEDNLQRVGRNARRHSVAS